MSLSTFLNSIKSKRIQSQLTFISNYRKVHNCAIDIMYHDNGVLIIDKNKNICILDLILA